jgi:hypothetical protein
MGRMTMTTVFRSSSSVFMRLRKHTKKPGTSDNLPGGILLASIFFSVVLGLAMLAFAVSPSTDPNGIGLPP